MNSNPKVLKSFLPIAPDSDFSIYGLPFGVIEPKGKPPRVAVAIGEWALDLSVLETKKVIATGSSESVFNRSSLNEFLKLGKSKWTDIRKQLQALLSSENPRLRDDKALQAECLLPQKDVKNLLPIQVGGFTDFYASESHATNVGKMFRGAENALMPNWKHMPIAYNGRASSVVVSGTSIVRPMGQIKGPNDALPSFGPSKKLDFELELGFVIGKESEMGQPIRAQDAEDYIFGVVLLNDWSARDIQAWEYQPLGPFLGKSFATTVSPWVVPLEALEAFKIKLEPKDPAPLPYLAGEAYVYNLDLEVELKTESSDPVTICKSNASHLYWSFSQMLAHHASNGCPMRVGDLLGTGTISGNEPNSWGSLLELSMNGTKPLEISKDQNRSFLENGDALTLKGYGKKGDVRVGFGIASGKILGSKN